MRRLLIAALLVALSAPAYADGGIAANRGTCTDGSPRAYFVVDGASSTDTLTIAVTGGDPTLAGDVDGLGSANDIDEASVEVELESVLDLENLQGAVTDGQVPNTITVDLATAATTATTATTANAGDSATAFFAAGVLEATYGGTGVNTLFSTGVPLVSSGTWTFNAGISHLAASTSADARGVLSDEVGTGAAMFGLISTMADDLACTGDQVVKRNAGDTAFECGTAAGGSGLTHPQVMARVAVGGGY